MQTLVFDPLGMKATTHDFAKAQTGNVAAAHAPDIDGKPALAEARANLSIVPVRPAGGAWSSVNDVMKYVVMELGEGKLPDGTTLHLEGGAARAARAAGRRRHRRHLRHGPDREHAVRHARRPSRRRHDRLPQRHDVAAGARRRRGDPDERRSRLARPHGVPAQAARGAVRRQPRGRRPDRGRREDVLRRDGGRAQAPDGAGRCRRGGQARRDVRATPRSARSS